MGSLLYLCTRYIWTVALKVTCVNTFVLSLKLDLSSYYVSLFACFVHDYSCIQEQVLLIRSEVSHCKGYVSEVKVVCIAVI